MRSKNNGGIFLDYKESSNALAQVLGKIKTRSYATPNELAIALNDWATKFAEPSPQSKYSVNKLIMLLSKQKYKTDLSNYSNNFVSGATKSRTSVKE